MATTAEPIASVHTVAVPRLTYKRAAPAIDFYIQAFGAKELFRFEVGGSVAHAEIQIGDSLIALSGEWPEGGRFSAETLGQSPVQVTLRVENVDAFAAAGGRGWSEGIESDSRSILRSPRRHLYGSLRLHLESFNGHRRYAS